jgi:hypothetical protein
MKRKVYDLDKNNISNKKIEKKIHNKVLQQKFKKKEGKYNNNK